MKNQTLVVMALWFVVGCGSSAQQPPSSSKGTNVNPDAGLMAEFKAKVDAYEDLRKDLQRKAPPLKETDDPAKIALAEKTLAQQVRAARANAKRGDIFTPATEAMFRRLLRPQVTGTKDATDNKAIIKDDAPKAGEVPFKVNGEYPKEAPLSTVPPDVLKALPPLPENLEYRFAGRHLLLYCSRGNLIVDYMLNAMP
jgi:hypothetical protein